MDVLRWPGDRPRPDGRSVATLGVFDGVHVGHAAILRRVVSEARRRSCRAAVVTFDRHPAAMLSAAPQPAITSLSHRTRLFESLGLDVCVVVRFTEAVARMAAVEFARGVFRDLLAAELLVLGEDGRFGRDREGDVALCRELGFEVQTVSAVRVAGRRVSSTAIRRAIRAGDFAEAEVLLGRAYSLFGTVVGGQRRGRRLGFPTANLDVHNEAIPPDGVYAAWAFADGEALPAAVSVGRRLTFGPDGDGGPVVEVHLIGRDEDLYGRDIEVRFVRRLRDQEAFPGPGALAAQIARDIEECRRLLGADEGAQRRGRSEL